MKIKSAFTTAIAAIHSPTLVGGELAASVGFSPDYLSTYFKKETSCTLSDYIRNERAAFSKWLFK